MSAEEIEALILRYEYADDQDAFTSLLCEVSRLVDCNRLADAENLARQISWRTGVRVVVSAPDPAFLTVH